jgi:two-component system, chemotaxis family, chemotaxis protein CheY
MSGLDSLDKNMPILVVDDYSTMRKVLRRCLQQLGFKNITEAENGQEALQKMEEANFKFVISDWHMPSMAGIDLLKTLRADDRFKELPFLIITPENHKDENSQVAVGAGVSNTIVKPFTASALEKKMAAIFSPEEEK